MVYETIWNDDEGNAIAYGSFATSNEVVVDATKSMKWSMGLRYSNVAEWCKDKRIEIHLTSEKTYV